jgi:hypothetical protein
VKVPVPRVPLLQLVSLQISGEVGKHLPERFQLF